MRRTILIAAIVAFYIAGAIWIVTDRRAAQHVYDEFSAANTSENGISLAYAYLQRDHKTELLTRPISAEFLPANAVVFRIGKWVEPQLVEEQEEDDKKPKSKERKRPDRHPLLTSEETDWIERGGRLVIATTGDVGGLSIRGVTSAVAQKVFPLSPDIDRIALPERRGIAPSTLDNRMHALYVSGDQVVVAREAIGRGDLIILSVPEMFQNRNLGLGNHLALLLALSGKGRPIEFDEYVHGLASADGALELLKSWGLGPFLLLVLATTALAVWRGARRVGQAEDDRKDTRSEAVDLVESLGALYRKSMTDAEALTLYRDALVRTVAAQSGLRGDALHQRVAELLGGPMSLRAKRRVPAAEFSQSLAAINAAFRKIEQQPRRHKRLEA